MGEIDKDLDDEDGVETDSDICDEYGVNKLFMKCESESEVVATKDFILHIDTTLDSEPKVIVATADKKCILYSIENNGVRKLHEFNNFKSKVIGCKFSGNDANLLYTGSSDGCINLLDIRTNEKPAITFRDTTALDKFKTFNCFDVSSNDRLLTAGTDVIDGDAFIVFWDTRKHGVLGGYWEAHTDDITQVKFHKDDMNKMISGSTDGLINLYDLTQTKEEDALLDTLNTESSVEELAWFNNNQKYCISCISHTSDLQLWDIDECEPYQTLNRLDISTKILKKQENFVYLAKCHETRNGLLVLAGSNYGDGELLRSLKVQKKTAEPYAYFKNNKQRIRDSSYNENNNILITGGEKGLLNIWKVTQPF